MSHELHPKPDVFERWQYRIFRVVLFVIFLSMMYQLLNQHTHIGDLIVGVLKRWF
jgi:hypothetical protein